MQKQGKQEIRIIEIGEAPIEDLVSFYRKTWSPSVTKENLEDSIFTTARNYPVFPGKPPPAYAFYIDNTIAGYIGTIPTRLWDGNDNLPAYWMKGFMVLEKYRNGPIGFLVLKEAMKHIDLAGVLTVASASQRLFEGVGFKQLGKLNNQLALVKAENVLSAINIENFSFFSFPGWVLKLVKLTQKTGLAWLGGLVIRALLSARDKYLLLRYGSGYQIEFTEQLDNLDEITGLWDELADSVNSVSVRDGIYISWRYLNRKDSKYSFVLVRNKSGLRAVGVVKHPAKTNDERLGSIRVSCLSDIISVPGEKNACLLALLRAKQLGRKLGADAIIASTSYRETVQLLGKAGYFNLPATVGFSLFNKNNMEFATRLDEWWLTRGDADSDGVL